MFKNIFASKRNQRRFYQRIYSEERISQCESLHYLQKYIIYKSISQYGMLQDGFKLRLGISKADSLQKERIELLSKLDLPSVGEFLLKPGTEPISDTLLAFLRVFSMRKAELTHWLRSDKVFDLKHVDCALETVVEENVRKFLLTRLQLLIANYPTTLKVKVKSDVAPSAFTLPSLSIAHD